MWELDDHPIRFAEVGCDCWIKVGRVADDTLIVRPLGAVERLVVAAPQRLDGGPLGDPAAAATLPFVTLAAFEGDRIALYGEDGSEVAFTPSVALSTNNIVAARRAACLGVGAAILPRWFVADELASGALVNVLPRWRAATLTIHVAYLPARHQPRRLALFLQAIEAGLREVPGIAPAGTR
ncbi:MAG: LysR substrate-binding domain-containing protein [Pseudomonadota bacterium]